MSSTRTFVVASWILTLSLVALESRADGADLYAERCASCHGVSGAADSPVGRALKIPPFEGASPSREAVRKLLAESKSHARIEPFSDAELDALMTHLATLTGSPETES